MISQTETPKGKIEYSFSGQGKPILFVHGGHVNCRETIFQKGLDPAKFCFISPSRPGYGNTLLTEFNKSPKATAELIIALLDELNVTKVTVIGISAGGLTAIEIASNYPERVENLILISALTKKWFTETDTVYRGGKLIFSPKIERFTWFLYRLFFKLFPKGMTQIMFKSLSKYRPIKFTDEEFNELKQMILNMSSGYGFVNDLDQTIEEEVLSRIECPTLILHSNFDHQVDIEHALHAKSKIANSRLVTFNNPWGHMLWFGKGYEPVLNEIKQQIFAK